MAYTGVPAVGGAPVPKGEERMTVWRITGGEGGPGGPRPERTAPRYDVVELDTPLLRIEGAADAPWLRVSGEVDVSNAGDLKRALRAARARVDGDLHLDLAAVDFIDVAGLRAFTLAARDLSERGGLLVLHSLSAHIDKLVRLIGWDAVPGLELHCRPRP
ncbi:STAS domain-containing protein [Actinomadura opuntiae]|uniref:STAS domain-containing protein n=1 Tax=Actinomadura sp. OS1-43 TaxID=604315 RepID=UPI00255A9AC7|nr:STAS domain-containing protein [Actinomadura sp. OS1-43]MDL4819835.1 STAS domain-containing protein [Actinomadura sp. OS1-43]